MRRLIAEDDAEVEIEMVAYFRRSGGDCGESVVSTDGRSQIGIDDAITQRHPVPGFERLFCKIKMWNSGMGVRMAFYSNHSVMVWWCLGA